MNWELPDVYKVDLEKAEEPEIKLPTLIGSWRRQGNSRKNIYFCFTDYPKAFDCGSQQIVENSSRDGNTGPNLPVSWKIFMQVKKKQLELDMEQQSGSKSGKESSRLYIVTLLI